MIEPMFLEMEVMADKKNDTGSRIGTRVIFHSYYKTEELNQ